MSTVTSTVLRRGCRIHTDHATGANPTAQAIMEALQPRKSASYVAVHGDLDEAVRHLSHQAGLHVVGAHRGGNADHARCPVLVVCSPASSSGPVLVALDDDAHAGDLVTYAAAEAARTGAVLRAVHVWTESAEEARCCRMSRHDCITDADRLLGELLYEYLPDGGERQIVHDDDPAGALIDLSRSAGLLVVGTRSRATASDDILGTTTTALLGNTRCPVAVLPH